jgi:hypothetical protein
MSVTSHHADCSPVNARQVSPSGVMAAPGFIEFSVLLRRALRTLLALTAIAAVTAAAGALQVAVWLPQFRH